MTVNDFIQAKEDNKAHHPNGHVELDVKYRAPKFLALASRQSRAVDKAQLEVPPPRFPPATPSRPAARDELPQQNLTAPRVIDLDNAKSIFDTDTEGVDDSTIADLSIFEDENAKHANAPLLGTQLSKNWRDVSELDEDDGWSTRLSEGVGDEANLHKGTLNFEDDNGKGADDIVRKGTYIRDQKPVFSIRDIYSTNHDMTEGTGSQRLEEYLVATSRQPTALQSDNAENRLKIASRFASIHSPFNPSQLPSNIGESAIVPRDVSHSPNKNLTLQNRFTSTGQRKYEHLVPPSTPRGASRTRTGQTRYDSPTREQESAHHGPFDVVDEEADYNESSDSSTHSRIAALPEHNEDESPGLQPPQTSKKRALIESDYPDEVLCQKSFSELDAEPFDHVPIRPSTSGPNPRPQSPPKPPSTPPRKQLEEAQSMTERVALVQSLSDTERREYLSGLPLTEWEDFGDELISEFGKMLVRIKEARQGRRKTAARFEAEIRRRHEDVQKDNGEIDRKLADMKKGGLGVLRGHQLDEDNKEEA